MKSREKERVICQGKFILLIYESETVWHLVFMLQTLNTYIVPLCTQRSVCF